MQYQLKSLADTQRLAQIIARSIVTNFVVALNGDLGAGKTTLVREVLYALGITGNVKSPTFTYVEPYMLPELRIYHFDLYRFGDPEEWFDLGFDEYFVHDSICFIEWAEKALELIPVLDWEINLEVSDEIHNCHIQAFTDKGRQCLEYLMVQGAHLFS